MSQIDDIIANIGSASNAGSLVRNTNTVVSVKVDAHLAERLQKQIEFENRKSTIHVSQCLTEVQWESMSRLYPEYQFDRGNVSSAPHGKAAALRTVERRKLIDLIGGFDFIDIGGSAIQHLKENRLVHCCAPVMDVRDAARHCEINRKIANLISAEALSKYNTDSVVYKNRINFAAHLDTNEYVCRQTAVECKHKANALMFLHSAYDIDFEELPEIMSNHGAEIAYGVMLFPPDAIIADDGYGGSHEFEYKIDKNNDVIRYHFRGDSSFSYAHSYSNVLKYVTKSSFVSGGYIKEIIDIRDSSFYFKITKLVGNVRAPTELTHRVWFPELREKVVVRYPSLDLRQGTKYSFLKTRMVSKVIPRQLYETISGWLVTCKSLNIRDTLTYARSANRRVVINGSSVAVPESIPIKDLVEVTNALYEYEEARRIDESNRHEFSRSVTAMQYNGDLQLLIQLFTDIKLKLKQGIFICMPMIMGKLRELVCGSSGNTLVRKLIDVVTQLVLIGCGIKVIIIIVEMICGEFLQRMANEFVVTVENAEEYAEYNSHAFEPGSDEKEIDAPCEDDIDKMRLLREGEQDDMSDDESDSDSTFPTGKEQKDQPRVIKAPNLGLFAGLADRAGLDGVVECSTPVSNSSNTLTVAAERENHAIQECIETENRINVDVRSSYLRMFGRVSSRGSISVEESASRENYYYGKVDDLEDYTRCVYRGEIVNVTDVEEGSTVLTGESLRYPDPEPLIQSLERALMLPAVEEKTAVVGVAGGGKTYRIKQFVSSGDVIISPLRDSVDELRSDDEVTNKIDCTRIRTNDSILYNSDRITRCNIFIQDEVGSAHAGKVYACERLLGAYSSYYTGDWKQIWAVNATSIPWQYNVVSIPEGSETLDVTYRCPADAAAFMTGWYGRSITSNNPILRGYRSIKINNVSDIPRDKDTVYICMYHSEVKILKEHGFIAVVSIKDINTTHFFQGKTVINVALVRLAKHDKELYSNMRYINVALSRHVQSCTYYTVCEDKISRLMREAVDLVNKNPRDYLTKEAYDKLYNSPINDDLVDASPLDYGSKSRCVSVRTDHPEELVLVDDEEEESLVSEETLSSTVVLDISSRNGNNVEVDDSIDIVGQKFLELEEVRTSTMDCVSLKGENVIPVFQTTIDEIFPGTSTQSNKFDPGDIQYKDLEVSVEGNASLPDDRGTKLDGVMAVPKLRTSMPNDARDTLYETFLGYIKRNANVPNTMVPLDTTRFYDDVWNKACDNLFVKNVQTRMSKINQKRIDVTTRSIQIWWDKQPEDKKRAIEGLLDNNASLTVDGTTMDRLFIMNKDKRKPKMTIGEIGDYPACQTLTFSDKDVNCLYGGVVTELHCRLKKLLKYNVSMVTDKSDAAIEQILNKCIVSGEVNKWFELDISKFDKSQCHELLEFEMYLYEKLGLDRLVSQVYSKIYKDVRVENFKNGFRCFLTGQRKSGAPTTLLGNTIINMFFVNYALDISTFDIAMFKGDDSIYANPTDGSTDSPLLELHCNFDSKPLITRYGYFCSSYIVKNANGNYVLAPDPIKRIESLGHRGRWNPDIMYERFISLGDLMRNYKDDVVKENLCEAVQHRLKLTVPSLHAAIVALNSVACDFNLFKTMWEPVPEEVHY